MDFETASEILKAIAHPVRLKILCGLMKDECNVSQMTGKTNVAQSTVSQHLAILRRQKIIVPKRIGNKRCYRIVDEKVIEILKILGK